MAAAYVKGDAEERLRIAQECEEQAARRRSRGRVHRRDEALGAGRAGTVNAPPAVQQ
jgi:hypothetical protein